MKKLVLLAALLSLLAAHNEAAAMVSTTRQQELVVHNRSTTSAITGFYTILNGSYDGENWLAGETWYEPNTIEPGASSTFTHGCANYPGVYVSDTITIELEWQDKETGETVKTSEYTDPCYSTDLYLTPEGQVYE